MTTRNDDHGGDPLKRLQVFVNCFDEQCRRTGLDAEVIIVEWNPPPDRPRIASLLSLPQPAFCLYRFIEVPSALHGTLHGGDVLPLFQMIAKNVGVRRARGRYVLATNIDIIMSTELVAFIAARRLDPDRLYRVDRHDVESNVRIDATLEEQLQYCASHHLRVHRRSGSDTVDGSGAPAPSADGVDIVDGRALRLGAGWFNREHAGGERWYRWAGERAELIVDAPAGGLSGPLLLELEAYCPGESTGASVDLIAVEGHRLLARTRIRGFARVTLQLDEREASERRIELRVVGGGVERGAHLPVFERREGLKYRVYAAACRPAAALESVEYPLDAWRNVASDGALMPTPDGLAIQTDLRSFSYAAQLGPLRSTTSGGLRFDLAATIVEGGLSIGVLSCRGRFWLPSRLTVHRHSTSLWYTLDVDVYAGQPFWLVISNDHPNGDGVSSGLIHRLDGPACVSRAEPAGAFSRLSSRPLAERAAVTYARVAPWLRATRTVLTTPVRRTATVGRLSDVVRLWLVGTLREDARRHVVHESPEFKSLAEALDASTAELSRLRELSSVGEMLRQRTPSDLHVNGCGDFQLMAREQWERLRGYPEFETFSMNIDSILSYMADAAGIKEQVLEWPIYHLEHEIGSGWSPEGETLLRKRIAERGITWVDATTVHLWATQMRWLGRPLIFNDSHWGMGRSALVESTSLQPVDAAT